MFSVYILKSKQNNSYYVGSCGDIMTRLVQHNNGQVKSTERYLPWKVIYQEMFKTLTEARKRERQIKSWKKRSAVERLFKKI